MAETALLLLSYLLYWHTSTNTDSCVFFFVGRPWGAGAAAAVSETALLLSGNYEGSFIVELTCPMHEGGLSTVRWRNTNVTGFTGTCFTGTKVQILTAACPMHEGGLSTVRWRNTNVTTCFTSTKVQILTAQKYKY